ncbi:MAG: fluoride efflux transporter CrcB [Gemmatimonadetes bacterium]|nr:MAG: fluoride efflux transporter CrcB [Gemmatimonadota bacterium]
MWIYVTLGGAFGALARYAVSGWVQDTVHSTFPWGTLVVNLTGSFLLGFGMRAMEALPVAAGTRALLTIGFLGAFTTFSTFSYETVALIRDGDWGRAVAYAGASLAMGLVAVFAGLAAASAVLRMRGVG